MIYGIFLGYHFTSAWLSMTATARNEFRRTHLDPVFARYADRVEAQHYDAEAFGTNPTDFLLLRTQDLRAYYFLIEDLRATPLFAEDLAVIDVIHIGIADGYRDYADQANNEEADTATG